MWDAIVGVFKGFLGGKAATQIGAGNKAVSGVTIGDHAGGVVLGDGNTVNFSPPTPPPKVPVVRVELACAKVPTGQIVHFLSITLLNTTDRGLFLGNVLLGTGKENIFVQADSLTGQRQHRRQLQAGDRFSFHIDAATLREIGRPATDYTIAIVEDAVGPPYKSEGNILKACVEDLLKDRP